MRQLRQLAFSNGVHLSHCCAPRLASSGVSCSSTEPIRCSGMETVSQHLCRSPVGVTTKPLGRTAPQMPRNLTGPERCDKPRSNAYACNCVSRSAYSPFVIQTDDTA